MKRLTDQTSATLPATRCRERRSDQTKAGVEYTAMLEAKLAKRVRGLSTPMGVSEWIVYPVLQVGDWRPIKGKFR